MKKLVLLAALVAIPCFTPAFACPRDLPARTDVSFKMDPPAKTNPAPKTRLVFAMPGHAPAGDTVSGINGV